MERLAPSAAAESAGGASAVRSTLYTLLAVALAAGVWVRFNPEITSLAPFLGAPSTLLQGDAETPVALVALGLVPLGQQKAAVAAMGLPDQDAALLIAALDRGRLRLAQLPLLDVSPTLQAPGHIVNVSSAGFTRGVILSREPVMVTVPVAPVGSITFTTAEPGGVDVLSQTLTGPVELPHLRPDRGLTVGVVAQ